VGGGERHKEREILAVSSGPLLCVLCDVKKAYNKKCHWQQRIVARMCGIIAILVEKHKQTSLSFFS